MSRRTASGAGSCSREASTRPRRSSRHGFPRSPTRPSTWSARWRRPQRHSRTCPSRRRKDDAVSGDGLQRLGTLLREQGGLMATLLAPAGSPGDDDGGSAGSPASVAAGGPRAAGRREEYELLVEAIYEGYLLHYGCPRVLRAPEADLGVLAGDQLYAIG